HLSVWHPIVPPRTSRCRTVSLYVSTNTISHRMYWTLELASHLEDAPWPATQEELIDYAERTGAPLEVVENLKALEDDGEPYESIEEIWPDYPTADDDFYYADE